MNPLQIRDHIRAQPFIPFRVYLSDGSHYDIRHPEFIAVTSRQVLVAIETEN